MPVSSPSPALLWIVSPQAAGRVAGRFAGTAFEWCYLGTDIGRREAVARALSTVRRVTVGDELTRVAHDVKQPFLDWIADMGRHQQDPLIWWGSTMASRSPLQTDLFLLMCYAELVKGWLERAEEHRPRLVVVEDPWLTLVLRRRYGRDHRVAFFGYHRGHCLWDVAWRRGTAVAAAIHTVLWAFRAMLRAQRIPRATDAAWAHSDRRAILLYSWIEPRCFAVPGKLVDPWTGRLNDLLTSRGETVRHLSALDIPARLMPALAAFASQLIVTPQYLRAGDILRAAWGWFRLHGLDRVALFQGWDAALLLRREQLREWGRGSFPRYRLLYAAMRRIAGRYGRQIKCVIYPFENQPWEKLLCLAWRHEAPQVRLVGYQHTWVPPLLLSYFLGTREREILPLPDRIVANSQFNLQLLQEGGYPPERLVNGGALRHEYLHSTVEPLSNQLIEGRRTRHSRGRVVLVTFPLLAPQARSLFADLMEEFQQPLVLGSDASPVVFIMKCHPRLPAELFYDHGKIRLPTWMSFSQEPMPTVLPRTDLLLYIGPTSSWWEAWLSGVPVLKYQADLLDIDAGPTIEGGALHSCSRDTLRFAITSLLGAAPPRQRPDPQRIEEFFGRVDEEVWAAVVRGEEPTLESHAVTAG